MKIIWTPAAAQDRADIWDYLHAVNPIAALEMDNRFIDAISRISQFPESGPVGIITGTRVNSPSKLSLGLSARAGRNLDTRTCPYLPTVAQER